MPPALALGERVAQVETKVEAAQAEITKVATGLDRLQFWMLATFGTTLASVLLLALTLATRGR